MRLHSQIHIQMQYHQLAVANNQKHNEHEQQQQQQKI